MTKWEIGIEALRPCAFNEKRPSEGDELLEIWGGEEGFELET
jgi:hypothetical protein